MVFGIPTGLLACVLSNDLGLTPITPMWAALWTVPPVFVGLVYQSSSKSRYGLPPEVFEESAAAEATGAEAPPDLAMAEPPRMAEADVPPPPPSMQPPRMAEADGPVAPTSMPPTMPPTMETSSAGPQARASSRATRSLPPREPDPPRTSYALLTAPDAVLAGAEFEVVVGMAPEATPGVAGGALVRPPSSQGAYVLAVQVVADGFRLRDGESWRHELPVSAAQPYPSFRIHLTAEPLNQQVAARSIQALYSAAGQSMGFAVRSIAVVQDARLIATMQPPAAEEPATMAAPTNEPAADLTVRIQLGDSESGGRLLWTFDTPHASVDLPDAPLVSDVGAQPEQFARQLVDGVGARDGQPGLNTYLIGLGNTISDQIPVEFWDVLQAAGQAASGQGRKPTVFLLSEEPYIPWELAVVDPPLDPDPAVPPFLGAQAAVGRWVLGQRRPKLPPPLAINIGSMAVISGEYNQPGWNRLVEAEKEAATLTESYGGVAVAATTEQVLGCLAGTPAAQALHFAVHGIYDPNSIMNGIVLTDGQTLDPLQVKGSMLRNSPFVFLNACQVGSANKVLGDYSGMAEAFLYAGASGVVAPLWSIDDVIAAEIALRFYEGAFDGTPPAEVLRRERAAFGVQQASGATCLAYVWYGHPSFKLTREGRP